MTKIYENSTNTVYLLKYFKLKIIRECYSMSAKVKFKLKNKNKNKNKNKKILIFIFSKIISCSMIEFNLKQR